MANGDKEKSPGIADIIGGAIKGTQKYWNPAWLSTQEDIEPEDKLNDMARKALTGGLLAAAITGYGYLRSDVTREDRAERLRKKLKERLTTQYKAIPSSTEIDLYETLTRKSEGKPQRKKKEKIEKESQDDDSQKVKALKGNFEKAWDMISQKAGPFHLPLVLASMFGGYKGGKYLTGKIFTESQSNKLQEDIDKINKNIGKLIEEEVKRTRGIKEEDKREDKEAEEKYAGLLETPKDAARFLGTTFILSALAGGGMGYLKGKSQNPEHVKQKEMERLISSRGKVKSGPQIIIPKSLSESGLRKKKSDKSQQKVPV